MIENEIYCSINNFLKLNIKKKTSYILVNKKFTGKICILTFGIERKVSLQEQSPGLRSKENQKRNEQDYN